MNGWTEKEFESRHIRNFLSVLMCFTFVFALGIKVWRSYITPYLEWRDAHGWIPIICKMRESAVISRKMRLKSAIYRLKLEMLYFLYYGRWTTDNQQFLVLSCGEKSGL